MSRDRDNPQRPPVSDIDAPADISSLEEAIGYRFRDGHLLRQALTHPSWANLGTTGSNQRLEFLGDAVLGFVIASELYRRFPELTEGRLTELRSALVCEASLAQRARSMQLGQYIFMDKGQVLQGGRNSSAILADTYEALVGAIYLDGGIRTARRVIVRQFLVGWKPEGDPAVAKNEKSLLQELAQAKGLRPQYRLIFQGGPEHKRVFAVRVFLGRRIVGEGWGFRKRDAERMAAREALKTIGF